MPHKHKEASPGKAKRPWYKNSLWYFFNSLKLTLGLLFTLAAVSILGTIIEQNKPVQYYLDLYGERWLNVIMYTGINDMYHTWWFTTLLAALAVHLIVCTFERFPPKWKSLLNHKREFDVKFIDRLRNSQSVTVDGDTDQAREKILGAFRRKRYRTMASGSTGDYRIYAWKGILGRLGSDAIHVSLLVILLGTIIGSFYGYKDFKGIYVGGSFEVPNADFDIRLDKFWIDYYDSGQIKQYNSLLTVVEDGQDVLQKQIWVNKPLYYKGIRFYQSTYGMAWNRVTKASIALMKKGKDKAETPVFVGWEEKKAIPDSPYEVKLIAYTADFAYDEKTQTVFSKSAEAENPAVMLEVYDNGKLVSTPWLFLKYPGIFPAIPDTEDDLVVITYQPTLYSGLSINKDPGTNVVWVGTAIMGIGFYLAFFVYHRRVWVTVKNSSRSTEVRIGGMINKNNLVFEKDIKDIVDALKST